MEFEVEQIDHVELAVPDRREAAAWYARVLGLRVVTEFQAWANDPRGPLMITTKNAGTKLALFAGGPSDCSVREASRSIQTLAFRVSGDGFLCFLERLEQLDLRNEEGDKVHRHDAVDHQGAYSLYFCDPWGHALELTSYDCDVIAAALSDPDKST